MNEPYEAPTLPEHAPALVAYLQGQVAVLNLRSQGMPNAPWPSANNAMFTYLLASAKDMFENGEDAGDLRTVLTWLAAHAWFEGALDRRADIAAAGADPHTVVRRPDRH